MVQSVGFEEMRTHSPAAAQHNLRILAVILSLSTHLRSIASNRMPFPFVPSCSPSVNTPPSTGASHRGKAAILHLSRISGPQPDSPEANH